MGTGGGEVWVKLAPWLLARLPQPRLWGPWDVG